MPPTVTVLQEKIIKLPVCFANHLKQNNNTLLSGLIHFSKSVLNNTLLRSFFYQIPVTP